MSQQITATVASQPISASVSGGVISASVGSSVISASAGGGVGPQGPQGPQGNLGAGLGDLTDVALSGVAEGDLLRYGAGGKWQNHKETSLILDGENF